jgi:DNA invertase Pin-like site-specific DNA recombinase
LVQYSFRHLSSQVKDYGFPEFVNRLTPLFRSALDALGVLAKLKDAGVSPHMIDLGGDVTSNGISKLVFTILSAVTEAERDRTRERITGVKRDQKRRGRYLGSEAPFGSSLGPDVPIPEQQLAIQRMWEPRAEGKSLMAIAEILRAEGTPISHMGVKSALRA